ncbi:M14 family zinc carboxypeptidase [Runella sp. MFBS21]|uniref:M14 family zinc carboxypeptidase n=1 Tax=Runella sp. MFBS21 TaxID=3034018 RepID=UPI0023F8EA37|nr:M14 family zinc carboxypeptidase [Runella sp. MFBS21]MDF7816572.1 M14 family zinc carboxypeptidase [Runella sp. MFBS21]
MKHLLLVVSFFCMSETIFAQSDLAQRLFDAHDLFKEKTITERRAFKHRHLVPLIDKLKASPKFKVIEAGKSFEGRSIFQAQYGNGAPPVLLWSQMHGDEATATMALLDIFNFLNASGDGFDDFRKKLAEKSTLYFVPMLNPDGVERWQRRTAQEIDMNRDALRLQCPESKLLKHLQQTLKPLVGFNLHDQSPRYSVGDSKEVAAISFLATAYNHERTINSVRERAMQLIVGMNRDLQKFIPNQVARYSDEFEPRAFGDNIAKWGTSLVLIESGGYKNDPEKQYLRKMNFIAILTALESIADGAYSREKRTEYEKIPQNGRNHFDLIIRNAKAELNGQTYTVDVAINRNEVSNADATAFSYRSSVEDFGDLSVFYGIDELDAQGGTLVDAKGKPIVLRLGDRGNFEIRAGKKGWKIESGFVKSL